MVSRTIAAMVAYFGQDGRRINHAFKVYGYAKAISAGEDLSEESRLVIELAAVLHDIGIHEAERKHSSTAGKYQELEGPPIAADILASIQLLPSIAERVCYLIGHHHSYQKIDGLDFQILVEADFLVNIEEDDVERDTIHRIRETIFRTESGKRIIQCRYDI